MANEESEEEPVVEDFDGDPQGLRDNDEISDAEEAFMEGYEDDEKEAEEEEKEEEELEK